MRLAVVGFASVAILVLASACGEEAVEPAPAPSVGLELPAGAEIVAKVGSGGITAMELARAVASTPPANGQTHSLEERKAILEELITEEVLFQEAARKGLHRDPKIRRILINLLLRDEVYSQVDATDFDDAELRAYFEAHREEFVIQERIQLWRIFIKTGPQRSEAEALALAAELRARLEGNAESFADLALQYSEDPFQRRGGDVGFITAEGRPGLDPLVVSTAFQLPEDVVSQPFVAGGGVNLVYVPERRERVERGFEQMKGAVLRKLKNERYDELTGSYVQRARARYPVQVDEGTLQSLTIPTDGAVQNHGHEDHLH